MKGEAVFFLVGGFLFLLVALFLREMNSPTANAIALMFVAMAFFWIVPQLIIHLMRRNK
jgi:hypothetical protein